MSSFQESLAAGPQPSSSTTLAESSTDASFAIPADVPNVLVFGETGIGKSALINMLANQEVAKTSSEAFGCTFESTAYKIDIDGKEYCVWDTAGLNEAEGGTVDPGLAVAQLANLAIKLHNRLNLLVYCIRGTRFRKIVKDNYELFHTVITGGRVPIVLVITGLEQENDMEDWWKQNGTELRQAGICVDGHACVTTTLGKMKNGEWIYQSEYDLSRGLVRDLVRAYCLDQAYVLQRAADIQNFVHWHSPAFGHNTIPQPASSSLMDSILDFLLRVSLFFLDRLARHAGDQLMLELIPATGSPSTRRHQSSDEDEWENMSENLYASDDEVHNPSRGRRIARQERAVEMDTHFASI